MDLTRADAEISVVPANEASWEDLELVLGTARCHAAQCYCQRFKIPDSEWRSVADEERAHRLRAQPTAGTPSRTRRADWWPVAAASPSGGAP